LISYLAILSPSIEFRSVEFSKSFNDCEIEKKSKKLGQRAEKAAYEKPEAAIC
jgi:hypothetical protein